MIKREKIIIIAIVFTLFATLIGLSYAFYTVTVKGNDSSNKNIVKSGNLEIAFNDGAAIDAQSMIPSDIVSKTFTVTNTGNRNITNYNVYFSKLYNTFTNDEIVYSMTCSSSVSTCVGANEAPLGTNYNAIRASNSLVVGETHTYTLYMEWIETSSTQDYNRDKMVGFSIKINESDTALVGTLKGPEGASDYTSDYYSYKTNITTVTFDNKINIPSDAVSSWDVSEDNNGTVMAYIKNNGMDGYDLYIQSDYEIFAPANSALLFGAMENLTSINNINYLNTSNVTNMSGMFIGLSTYSLDLSSFDTSNVTNMHNMFLGTSFDTLNLSSFDTSNVTNMSGMFNYGGMATLNLSSFDTSKVTDVSNMFSNNSSLTSVNFANAMFDSVVSYNEMFSYPQGLSVTATANNADSQAFLNYMLSMASSMGQS